MTAPTTQFTSGLPVQVAYSDTTRTTGVAMRRVRARAWVVWGDTAERQPRACERDRAVARSTAVAVARGPRRR